VNVDVGFPSLENFVPATTKNFTQRIYLDRGIFADLTYYFHEGDLRVQPWTYPDYRDEQKLNFFRWAARSWSRRSSTDSRCQTSPSFHLESLLIPFFPKLTKGTPCKFSSRCSLTLRRS
jgi:hypothetical protein